MARPAGHLSPNGPPIPDEPLSPHKQPSSSSFGAAELMRDDQRREASKPYTRHKRDAPTAPPAPTAGQADTVMHLASTEIYGPSLATEGNRLHVSPTSIIGSDHTAQLETGHRSPEGAINAAPAPTGGCPRTEWAKVGNLLFVGCAQCQDYIASPLQPYVAYHETSMITGCNPTCPRLQAYAPTLHTPQVRRVLQRLLGHVRGKGGSCEDAQAGAPRE